MKEMKCVKDYSGIGFLRNNTNKNGSINIKVGDSIECDNKGYLWFRNVCLGHKDTIPGKYFEVL